LAPILAADIRDAGPPRILQTLRYAVVTTAGPETAAVTTLSTPKSTPAVEGGRGCDWFRSHGVGLPEADITPISGHDDECFRAVGAPSNMDDEPAQPVTPHQTGGLSAGSSLNHQHSAALDERDLDRRGAQLARREHANDLRDLAAYDYEVDDDLYPSMDD
jgi:hypothetical protein